MTPKQAQDYILGQLNIMAEHVHPGNKDLQNQFKIGFLTGQLASAMYRDSIYYTLFRKRVHELGYTLPKSTVNKQ